MKTLYAIIFASAILAAACTTIVDPAPEITDLTGSWTATLDRQRDTWSFDMMLVQSHDSLSGMTTVRSASGFSDAYRTTGRVSSSDVVLTMLPVEDATIHVRATLTLGRISGLLWFNTDSLNAQAITFLRK